MKTWHISPQSCFSSCGFEDLDADSGSLELSIDEQLLAQTLLPLISMEIASYDINGAGPVTYIKKKALLH